MEKIKGLDKVAKSPDLPKGKRLVHYYQDKKTGKAVPLSGSKEPEYGFGTHGELRRLHAKPKMTKKERRKYRAALQDSDKITGETKLEKFRRES